MMSCSKEGHESQEEKEFDLSDDVSHCDAIE